MQRQQQNALYTTESVQDLREGWAAVELQRTVAGVAERVARVVFWDAEGQFALEMSASELPLDIVEKLIEEARATIRIT